MPKQKPTPAQVGDTVTNDSVTATVVEAGAVSLILDTGRRVERTKFKVVAS